MRNPYADNELKKQISINLNKSIVDYFKEMANKI